ncbi:MAG: hypothetical protein C4295_10335 [Candidatus Fervidibacterota bacterium]
MAKKYLSTKQRIWLKSAIVLVLLGIIVGVLILLQQGLRRYKERQEMEIRVSKVVNFIGSVFDVSFSALVVSIEDEKKHFINAAIEPGKTRLIDAYGKPVSLRDLKRGVLVSVKGKLIQTVVIGSKVEYSILADEIRILGR